MPRRDVNAAGEYLLDYGIFYWPLIKSEYLRSLKGKFPNPPKKRLTNNSKKQLKSLLDLEMVINAVHYAETLGSYLLAFEKHGKAVQRAFMNYKIDDVKDFYEKIPNRSISYIAKILSYPHPYMVTSMKGKRIVRTSCVEGKRKLISIAKYYYENLDLYNSYKHGLRIGAFLSRDPDSKKSYPIIGCLLRDKSFYPARIKMARLDAKKAKEITREAYAILSLSISNYKNMVLDKKTDFTSRTLK